MTFPAEFSSVADSTSVGVVLRSRFHASDARGSTRRVFMARACVNIAVKQLRSRLLLDVSPFGPAMLPLRLSLALLTALWCSTVLAQDNDRAEEFAEIGEAHLANQEFPKAIAALTKAIELDPKNAEYRYSRAMASMFSGGVNAAIADLDEIVRLDRRHARALMMRGNLRVRKGKLDEAIADYDAAIKLEPVDAFFLSRRGIAWLKKKDIAKAFADFDRAIEVGPDEIDGYVARAEANYEREKFEDAIRDYTSALKIDAEYAPALVFRGLAYYYTDKLDEASADLNGAIRLLPGDDFALVARGRVRADLGKLDDAIADFNEAIRLDPKNASAWRARSMVRSRQRKDSEAIADQTEVIRLDPHPDEYARRGLLHFAARDKRKAREDFDTAIRLDPTEANHFRWRARLSHSEERHADALADLNKAIELAKSAELLEDRASVYRSMKEYRKALTDLNEAVKLESHYDNRFSRGWIHSRLNQYAEALVDFTECVRLEPEVPDPYNERAWIWAACPDEKIRNGKLAVADATKACELAEWKNPVFLDTLAGSEAESGRFELAVKWQEKAVELAAESRKDDYRSRLAVYKSGKPYREYR